MIYGKSVVNLETTKHHQYMQYALLEAQKAFDCDEVPIGAIIVYKKRIISRGFNCRESLQSPTAHAEMIAIEEAATALKQWRLQNTTLYTTLEPCAMCAGAIVLARIAEVVFAAEDPKAGACGSVFDIVSETRLNHRPKIIKNICTVEARLLLQKFFRKQRKRPKYCKSKI